MGYSKTSDAFAAARRLLGCAATLAWDAGRRGGDPPRRLDEIGAAWLAAALAPRFPGLRIRSLRRLDSHSGTTTRARLAIETDGAYGAPRTLFAKLTPAGFVQRVFAHAMGLGAHEVRFYRELARDLPVRVPEVYAAVTSPGARRFVLLLEDLEAAGCEFVTVGEHTTLAQAESVVDALASLHARFWESPRFEGELAWVRCAENRGPGLPLERALTAAMLGAARRRAGGGSREFQRACRLVAEQRDAIEREWARGPRTLVHGDCHVGNLFFASGRPGFLDWQVLARAPGARDLSYFLCNSLPTELRRSHQHALVARYCGALGRDGGPELSTEAAWEGVRLFALYCWLSAAFTVGAGSGLQSGAIARAGLERSQRAIEDLGTLELLAERGIR